jgi:hypothetical protein
VTDTTPNDVKLLSAKVRIAGQTPVYGIPFPVQLLNENGGVPVAVIPIVSVRKLTPASEFHVSLTAAPVKLGA